MQDRSNQAHHGGLPEARYLIVALYRNGDAYRVEYCQDLEKMPEADQDQIDDARYRAPDDAYISVTAEIAEAFAAEAETPTFTRPRPWPGR